MAKGGSGKGWSYDVKRPLKPYKANISVDGRTKYLGHFATPGEATKAYHAALEIYPRKKPSGGNGGYTYSEMRCKICGGWYKEKSIYRHYPSCLKSFKADFPDVELDEAILQEIATAKEHVK